MASTVKRLGGYEFDLVSVELPSTLPRPHAGAVDPRQSLAKLRRRSPPSRDTPWLT
jgi:hypothetical protein